MITLIWEFFKDLLSFEEFYIDYTDDIQDFKKEVQNLNEISNYLNSNLHQINSLASNFEQISLEGITNIQIFSKEDWNFFDQSLNLLIEKNLTKSYENIFEQIHICLENTTKLSYELTTEVVNYNQTLLLWEHTNQLSNISSLLNSLPSLKDKNNSLGVLNELIDKQIQDKKLSNHWKSQNFLIKLNSYNLFEDSLKNKKKEETLIKIQKDFLEKNLPRLGNYFK